ncbi:MAG: peptidoglycan bridge formation glycyltransferase FemA/FemB family protein [Candidatus Paceibacterota bacterium]
MLIKEINDKKTWEDFFRARKEKTFLQSWDWGEFHIAEGSKIWRLAVVDGSELLAVALVVKIKARRGTYLLVQHGPVVASSESQVRSSILKYFLKELAKIGKKEGASFIRMNPLWERTSANNEILRNLGLRRAPMHASAYEATWKLDISPSEDDLFRALRKTTRYIIKNVEKIDEIVVEKSDSLGDLGVYQKLNKEVALRQQFVPFSDDYIKREFEVFKKDDQALFFFGKYKNEIVAGALVIFWQGVGYYHQAASLSKYAKLSIPYLLQWEAIREAKKRGCDFYDFWGYVDPKANPNHPWAGPTLFKMGYGGQAYEYILTQDYPLSPLYWLTYVFEQIRKRKRNL